MFSKNSIIFTFWILLLCPNFGSSDYHYGICWSKRGNKWQARRCFGGKIVYGGLFSDVEKAKCASDNLVYDYEMKTGYRSQHKLNFVRRNEPPKHFVFKAETERSWTKRDRKWEEQRTIYKDKMYGCFSNLHPADDFFHECEVTTGKELKTKFNFAQRHELPQNVGLKWGTERLENINVNHGDIRSKKWHAQRMIYREKMCGGYFFKEVNCASDIFFEIKSRSQCKNTLDLLGKCQLTHNVAKKAKKSSIGDEEIAENLYGGCFPCLNVPVDLMYKCENQIGEPNLIIQLSRLSNHSHYILKN